MHQNAEEAEKAYKKQYKKQIKKQKKEEKQRKSKVDAQKKSRYIQKTLPLNKTILKILLSKRKDRVLESRFLSPDD